MQALIEVILPVFLVLGFGYFAVWKGLFSDAAVDGLVRFTQNFAIPCLLFRAISDLDLSANFNAPLLISFYAGAIISFIIGMTGARLFFDRNWGDAVAIGFCCLFSNTVLLGLPITERAYGSEALAGNYAIIAVHAPIGYLIGVTAMEIARAGGGSLRLTAPRVVNAMFHNALVIGIALGMMVNLSGVTLPGVLLDAVDLMVRAAIPAALFGLGGVLFRYKPEGDIKTILMVCAISLVVHPGIAFGIGSFLGLGTDAMRSAVVTAAMAPGVNTYIFANMYGAARRVAASSVLIATAASLLSVWLWLLVLP
ncbi:AEC family transporter [Alphaproteobacteria bacterium GH1-50]|uniref:AEC family transporter n=1 Tax=Kangsaoukella pontilimi TaxID=2691042 RepID=A0A7C9MZ82_9RHOB|nr:AEC family transporter [Kangsaoukella pontilimi]MXQ07278.1 AEC family transporter [Kangsaoukella pontilimi]